MNFSTFCQGSPLLDVNKLWNNSYPEFTTCFTHTVLTATPGVWLWLTSPILLVLVHKWDKLKAHVPVGRLNIAKCVLTALIAVLSVVLVNTAIITHVRRSESCFKADVVFQSFRTLSLIYSVVLLQLIRQAGTVTSGFLFMFWMLELLTKVPQLYEHIIHPANFTLLIISVFYIDLAFVIAMVILNCFAESRLPTINIDGRKQAPEMSASFLSRITFSYFFPLLRLGYKKPIVEDDIWDLRPDLTSTHIMQRFQPGWSRMYESFRNKKRNVAQKSRTLNSTINQSPEDTHDNAPNEMSPLVAPPKVKVVQSKKKDIKYISVTKALLKTFFWEALGTQFLVLLHLTFVFVQPMVLSDLINFSNQSLATYRQPWKGYMLAVALFLCASFMCTAFHNLLVNGFRIGIRIRAVLVSIIYKKALTISSMARRESTIGEIVNLMSVDVQHILFLCLYAWQVWSSPLEIVVALVLLYRTMGPSVFAGLGVIVLLIPVNAVIMTKLSKLQERQMTQKDERVKMMSEVLSGIKVLKLYAWEASFEEKVNMIRRRELETIRSINYLNAFSQLMWTMTPYLVSLATFAVYIYISPDHYLGPDKAFVAISLFNILRFSVNCFPLVITDIIRAKVSLDRISRYLSHDDIETNNVTHDVSEGATVVIEDGNFQWDPALGLSLRGINLRVKEGQLLAVVGQVGSGKSSLISAILGDMKKITGRVNVKGKVAYVPQEAWIQNATLRDNILFGRPYNKKPFKKLLKDCALMADLDVLRAGDLTEIGEKGINLSGGQKQRVSLARAIYNDADIYLLDDPLSAVDSHVGKHIFDQVLSKTGVLGKKTCILVTHGIHWLPRVDEIIVMVNGEISERGTYSRLVENDGAFAQFLRTYQEPTANRTNTENDVVSEKTSSVSRQISSLSNTTVLDKQISLTPELSLDLPLTSRLSSSPFAKYGSLDEFSQPERKPCIIARVESHESTISQSSDLKPASQPTGDTLVEEERNEEGSVKLSVYLAYFRAMGVVSVAVFTAIYAVYMAFTAAANVWLSNWTDDPLLANFSATNNSATRLARNSYYLGVYGAYGCAQSFLVLLSSLGMANCYMRGSQRLHDGMLHTIVRCAMSFFDTTPSGRIMNRFSKDMDAVDEELPNVFGMLVDCTFIVISTLIIISYSTPIFLSVILPLFLLFYIIQKPYLMTSRQLQRIQSRTKSPIFSHFSESVNGASVIRAYKVQDRFIHESEKKTDYNQMCYYYSVVSKRWLGFYLDMLGNLLLLAATIFAVSEKDNISSSIVGLSISYAMEITGSLTWMVRMATAMETNIVSVERIKEYSDVKTEAEWHTSNGPHPGWPDCGNVTFDQYTTRYRPGLDLVLKGINIYVKPGEKVGIVGRTGAGKSSMTLSLFRIIEAAGGSIMVDGWNIADMGLHDLRANLTILPQDPVLFSGSLRMNLDPLDAYSDHDIWTALEHAHLKSFVESLPENLEHECGEGGSNLSVGQKQLVCLARSLLRKTKILILDEATAAVDMETDELIQETIKSEFSDCTILTIAHRLNTILDYDKILVLDNGLVKEFDTPAVLLANPESAFYSMTANAGITASSLRK